MLPLMLAKEHGNQKCEVLAKSTQLVGLTLQDTTAVGKPRWLPL